MCSRNERRLTNSYFGRLNKIPSEDLCQPRKPRNKPLKLRRTGNIGPVYGNYKLLMCLGLRIRIELQVNAAWALASSETLRPRLAQIRSSKILADEGNSSVARWISIPLMYRQFAASRSGTRSTWYWNVASRSIRWKQNMNTTESGNI